MQINKFIPTRIVPLAALALGLLGFALLPIDLAGAENEPVSDKPPVPVVTQPPPGAIEVQSDTDANAAQKPPVIRATAKPVKEFKPSETIGADSAVSFPVDI
jgi:hypothetical protein